jgi:peptide/nickel transport system permease protein/oligopeptide transport system permease protein
MAGTEGYMGESAENDVMELVGGELASGLGNSEPGDSGLGAGGLGGGQSGAPGGASARGQNSVSDGGLNMDPAGGPGAAPNAGFGGAPNVGLAGGPGVASGYGCGYGPDDELLAEKAPSFFKDIAVRFCRNRLALASLAALLLIAAIAVFAPLIAPYSPYAGELSMINAKPSAAHLLGCDENGRDVLSRLIYGARISLTVGFLAVAIQTAISIVIGLFVAYYGGVLDTVVMRFLDMLMAFPGILLAIIFMSVFGKGLENAIMAITIVGIPSATRMVRATAISAKESDYVQAARAIGCNSLSIMFRHILPNIMALIIVTATMSISGTILSTAALGFLGLGVQPPTAEWGTMLSMGKNFIYSAPYLVMFPGAAIAVTILAFNLFGDGLRDALDPRLK